MKKRTTFLFIWSRAYRVCEQGVPLTKTDQRGAMQQNILSTKFSFGEKFKNSHFEIYSNVVLRHPHKGLNSHLILVTLPLYYYGIDAKKNIEKKVVGCIFSVKDWDCRWIYCGRRVGMRSRVSPYFASKRNEAKWKIVWIWPGPDP